MIPRNPIPRNIAAALATLLARAKDPHTRESGHRQLARKDGRTVLTTAMRRGRPR